GRPAGQPRAARRSPARRRRGPPPPHHQRRLPGRRLQPRDGPRVARRARGPLPARHRARETRMSDHDKPTQVRTARALAGVAMAELFPTLAREVHADELKGRLVNLLLSLFRAADKPTRDWLLDLVPVLEGNTHPHPPELIAWLRNQIGHKGLEAWVRTHSGLPAKELAGSGPRKLVAHWLSGSSGADLEALLSAGARFRIQNETPA